jgi:hypothetical protein
MTLEFLPNDNREVIPASRFEIKPDFRDFIPQEFIQNPTEYFEQNGKNIKTGEIKTDNEGKIREDPTAVKDLPIWKNSKGEELHTVGKRVNIKKGIVGESGDPFYEYGILEELVRKGLPAAKPVLKVEQGGTHIIVTERIPGIRWSERNNLALKEKGYSDADIENLMTELKQKMYELKIRFDEARVIRPWKLKDLVFQIDIENKRVIAVIPTDWERTKIINKGRKSK